jgi:polyisoprenoid-binding protein YceI
VYKTGLLSGKTHEFLFERYRGKIHLDRAVPGRSRIEISVDGASVVCTDTWVSAKDLKKILAVALNDMMKVEEHPALLFSSSRVTALGANQFLVEGSLTIRGISNPAVAEVAFSEHPDGSLAFAGKSEVRLKDYGLKPPTALFGAIGTKNEMTVEFTLFAARRDD